MNEPYLSIINSLAILFIAGILWWYTKYGAKLQVKAIMKDYAYGGLDE